MTDRPYRGYHSGVIIAPARIGELGDKECKACEGHNLHLTKIHSQVPGDLEPVRGEPYPTFAYYDCDELDIRCLDCGAHYGTMTVVESRLPVEVLAWDVLTRRRIDLAYAADFLGED